ncbi:MAG: N-acetyltransferase family protein [Bauldia sp.]
MHTTSPFPHAGKGFRAGATYPRRAPTEAREIVASSEREDRRYAIVRPEADREAIADSILTALPRWFGRPASTAAYIRTAGRSPMIAAMFEDTAVGFLTLVEGPQPAEREIAVMGIDPAHHRRGLGTLMVRTALADCRRDGIATLCVHTLGPSHPDLAYGGTRAFYRAIGLIDVVETIDAWGPGTPSLLMRMAVPALPAAGSRNAGRRT